MNSFSMSLCLLLSLCCVFNVPACINVSRPPLRLLIYESYPGLSLLPPEGSIDGPICRVCHQENRLMSTNIMNILLTTYALQHIRFRRYIRDYILRCYKKFWVISFCRKIIFWQRPSKNVMFHGKYLCGSNSPPCFDINLSLDPHIILCNTPFCLLFKHCKIR